MVLMCKLGERAVKIINEVACLYEREKGFARVRARARARVCVCVCVCVQGVFTPTRFKRVLDMISEYYNANVLI